MSDHSEIFIDRLIDAQRHYDEGHIGIQGLIGMQIRIESEWRSDLKDRAAAADRAQLDHDLARIEAARVQEHRYQLRQRAAQTEPATAGSKGRRSMEYKRLAAAGQIEHATFACNLKTTYSATPGDRPARFGTLAADGDDGDDDGNGLVMMAAIFGNEDRQGDVIVPGAFKNLDEFCASGWLAWSHKNEHLPIGFPLSARQTSRGLEVSGEWHTTAHAQECKTMVRERMRAGRAVKCSIGYAVNDGGASIETRNGRRVRVLSSLALFEASIVLLPANELAEVISA